MPRATSKIQEYAIGARRGSPGKFLALYALPGDERMAPCYNAAGDLREFNTREGATAFAALYLANKLQIAGLTFESVLSDREA